MRTEDIASVNDSRGDRTREVIASAADYLLRADGADADEARPEELARERWELTRDECVDIRVDLAADETTRSSRRCCVTGSERALEFNGGRSGAPSDRRAPDLVPPAQRAPARVPSARDTRQAATALPTPVARFSGWHPARPAAVIPQWRRPPAHGCPAAISSTRSGDPPGRNASG